MKILFLGKENDLLCKKALDVLLMKGVETESYLGNRFTPRPKIKSDRYDFIFSYIAPWIIPSSWILRAKRAAINFHPGPPQYPGIGCTNFAIYHHEKEFGVTAHHMAQKVDSGKIIAVKRFPLYPDDSVFSLTQRCYENIYQLFVEMLPSLLEGKPLEESKEKWTRKPFLRKELDKLCLILPDMDEEEIRRRVRATAFPNYPAPVIELAGFRFVYQPPKV